MPDDNNLPLKNKIRRGRKQKIGTANSDFILEDARDRALELQTKYAAEDAARRRRARAKGEILDKGGFSPLKRALKDILRDPQFKEYFGPIDAVTLQNQLSLTKKVRVEDSDCPVEQEEAQAAWEARQSKTNCRECNERPDGVQPDTKPEEDAQ